MSVTFWIAKESLDWKCDAQGGEVYVRYQEMAPPDFDPTPVVDPEMPEYGAIAPMNPWSLNVSNANAFDILRTLGFEFEELCGTLEAKELLKRCYDALDLVTAEPGLDPSRPSRRVGGDGYCKVILCGRPESYLQERFTKLAELARIAVDHEALISFA